MGALHSAIIPQPHLKKVDFAPLGSSQRSQNQPFLGELTCKQRYQLRNIYPLLLARVAMAERNGVFEARILSERVKVDSDAPRRTHLVLTAIALADIAVVVHSNAESRGASRTPRALLATSSGLFLSSGKTAALIGASSFESFNTTLGSPPSSSSV